MTEAHVWIQREFPHICVHPDARVGQITRCAVCRWVLNKFNRWGDPK